MRLGIVRFGFLLCAIAAPAVTLAHFTNTGINAVQVDAAGSIYIAGFQGTVGSADTYDAFIAKLTPDGSRVLYSTKFAGSKSDFASALALDSTGAAYITGQTQSLDFPVTTGGTSGQGFVAKVDPQGNVIYATLIGGTANSGPAGLLAGAAGETYVSGQTSGSGFPTTPGAAVTGTDSLAGFVIKLDNAGKVLAAIRGVGGRMALDAQGNLYVASALYGEPSAIPITPGAFQATFQLNGCGGTGQLGIACTYQYVTKLNAALTQVVYSTFVTGSHGAAPAAISVDAQGNALLAGTTKSPDYPTTANGFQPIYIANAPPGPDVGLFGTIYPPPASGFVTKLNATGTGLLYSTLFSGTQADTISFAAFTSGGIYFSGQAGSADLPGLDGVPAQCLPEIYESRMSLDGTSVSAARIVAGNVLAYDPGTGTFLSWTGTDLLRFDPVDPPPAIACILDAADLRPVTAIAPGEILSIFGPLFLNWTSSRPTASFPTSLFGISVSFSGTAGPLMYVSPRQINVQAPYEISGNPQVTVALTLAQNGPVAGSQTLPVVPSNPTVFLDSVTPLSSVGFDRCSLSGVVYEGGPLPLAFNSDGSRNTCSNPAPAGSPVTLLVQGLGVTAASVTGGINPTPGPALSVPVTTNSFGSASIATVVSAGALGGAISGIWQIALKIAPNDYGAVPISLTAGGVAVRDTNLTIWVK